jgi:VWFA-related protein
MMRRQFAVLTIFFLTFALQASAQTAAFSVAAEEVRIDVLVTEKGKPVAGLQASDFEVLDNDVPQKIQYVTLQKQTPIQATLVFDLSMSVAGKVHDRLKEASNAFLADLGKEDHVALVMFNNAVILGSRSTRDFENLKLSLERAHPAGRSALIDASYAALMLAESKSDPPLLIIFSDGRDTCSWLTAPAVLETAKRNDAVVYAVSTGRLPESTFLKELTRISGGSEIEFSTDLTFAFLQILQEFRQNYLLTYIPHGVPEGGWHRLNVRVKNSTVKVRSRPGYLRDASKE